MKFNSEQRSPMSIFGKPLWLLSCLCLLGFPFPGLTQENGLSQRSFNVGYRVLDLKGRLNGSEKTLAVAVWYPTAAPANPHNYGGPTGGIVAKDAPPLTTCGPYPILFFSHGYGGSGIGSVFFTEALAARGWIVVAPDHHDRHLAVRIRTGQLTNFDRWGLLQHAREIAASNPEKRGNFLYRLDEIQFTIDQMIGSKPFQDVIDSSRIAIGGHSFGGYTALGLCGTIKERLDSRIKAVLLFSTGAGGYLFTEKELGNVLIPSMLIMGERERNALRGTQTMFQLEEKIYNALGSPKYFLEIKEGVHGSFCNRFSENLGARLLSGTEEQFEVIRRYGIAFLEKHVARRADPDKTLETNHGLVTRYLREIAPERHAPSPSTEQGAQAPASEMSH